MSSKSTVIHAKLCHFLLGEAGQVGENRPIIPVVRNPVFILR